MSPFQENQIPQRLFRVRSPFFLEGPLSLISLPRKIPQPAPTPPPYPHQKLVVWFQKTKKTESPLDQNRLFACLSIQNAALHSKTRDKKSESLDRGRKVRVVRAFRKSDMTLCKQRRAASPRQSLGSILTTISGGNGHSIAKKPLGRRAGLTRQFVRQKLAQLTRQQIATQNEQLGRSMQEYEDFIDIVSLSNHRRFRCSRPPTVYVSRHNNGDLALALLRRRYWLRFEDEPKPGTNIIWHNKYQFKKCQFQASQWSSQLDRESRLIASRHQQVGQLFSFRGIEYGQKPPPYCTASLTPTDSAPLSLLNCLPGSTCITAKAGLFRTLSGFLAVSGSDVNQFIPRTFLLESVAHLCQVRRAVDSEGGLWIVKPGEGTNRGRGIVVVRSSREIQARVGEDPNRSYIVQKYLEKPLLYRGRKFDIRAFLLVTAVFGCVKAYFYDEGYARTSSYEFSLEALDQRIHLTNDALQCRFQSYGKFQSANKLSLGELGRYFEERGLDFGATWRRIKELSTCVAKSAWSRLGADLVPVGYQLFGLDFMVEETGRALLIQVNDNPCLETSGSVLSVLIPQLVENALRLAVDPLFPPPARRRKARCPFPSPYRLNRFVLVFDSLSRDSQI